MSYWDEVLADSPSILWKLDEASGTLVDTQTGNDGTAAGGVTYRAAGPDATGIPYGLTFNGTTGYVSAADSADFPADVFSVEFWVKRTVTGGTQVILDKGTGGAIAWMVYFTAGGNVRFAKSSSGAGIILSGAITDTTTWHHIVITKNGATSHVYKDGAVSETNETPATLFDSTSTFYMGRSVSGADWLNGSLAAVAIYPTALSATRVAAHYAARTVGGGTFSRVDSLTLSEVQTILVTPADTLALTEGTATTTADAITAKTASDTIGLTEAPAVPTVPFAPTVTPTLTVRIDWNNDGDFGDANETLTGRVLDCNWTRGASADFSGEAIGAATFVLDNFDDLYTPSAPSGSITAAQLVPGRPVHIYATYLGVDYPRFFGYIERLTPRPADRTVTITCYDPLRRYQETDIVVAANDFVQRSARDMRIEVLSDFERGTRNLIGNPEFATDTAGWTVSNGTITRTASAPPSPAPGSTYGEFARTAGTATLEHLRSLTPVFFAGNVYRFSVWLWVAAGTLSVTLGIGEDSGISVYTSRSVTATTTPVRHTITYTAPTTRSGNDSQVPRPFLTLASGTVLLGGAAFTRGQALPPYAAVGTGRWPNWCGNGSFDGGALNGWYDGWTNLVGNPSFETNTTGWSVAGDAFVGAATSITRVASSPRFGTARADVAGAANSGAFHAITGTFKAGVTYAASVYARVSAGSGSFRVGIGSQGTPADKAESASTTTTTSYQKIGITWTPSADRTDVHLYVKLMDGSTHMIDGAAVFRRDNASAVDPAYADTGPGSGGSFVTTRSLSTIAKYGSQSQEVVTPATATAGRVYDFNHTKPYFVSGQPYTASIWLNPSSNMPYKVGFAANKGDGTFDESTPVTGTATANVWTQMTVTLTPSADRSSVTPFDVVLYVYQTDAIARTFLIDGVRVIPGSSADDFEMSHWALAAESDTYLTSASLSGSALAALTQLNGYTLTRHWIEPAMAAPWYTYVTRSRDDLATKASAETFDDDLSDMSVADIDRASIINVVPVAHSTGTDYYSDEDSVGLPTGDGYGPRPTGAIGSSAFFGGRTIGDIIGPALVARYKDPRARPEITLENRWPSQLQRELDDLVTVNFARLGISGGKYLILRLTTTVSESGQKWETKYALEEHAY